MEEVEQVAGKAFDDIGEECVRRLKSTSPRSNAKSKHYADGWRLQKGKRLGSPTVVYNATKPGLTHLLEHGHAITGTGRRAKAMPHIAPVAEWAENQIEREIIKGIEK